MVYTWYMLAGIYHGKGGTEQTHRGLQVVYTIRIAYMVMDMVYQVYTRYILIYDHILGIYQVYTTNQLCIHHVYTNIC